MSTSNSGDTTEHFSLDSYDQNNITNMFYSVMAGVEEYPYHADGKECTTYSKSDIVAIYVAAQSTITYHTTYNNMLRVLVNRTNDVETLAGITYGMELPQDLAAIMQENIDNGIKKSGILPGSIRLQRRAPEMHKRLQERFENNADDALFILDWVNLWAFAVAEENAAGGKIITAPTMGAAGIMPAVMRYYQRFCS